MSTNINNNRYNLGNLSSIFKSYLLFNLDLTSGTIKNYLSDLRYFLAWLSSHRAVSSNNLNTNNSNENLLLFCTKNNVIEYRNYLLANNIPRKSINRRLSTLRLFFKICCDENLINLNPIIDIPNVIYELNKPDYFFLINEYISKNVNSESLTDKYVSDDLEEFIHLIK
jgi:site-specific recombinase XerD